MEVQWTENRRDERKLEGDFENNFKIPLFGLTLGVDDD
jgi:hypothetical protein